MLFCDETVTKNTQSMLKWFMIMLVAVPAGLTAGRIIGVVKDDRTGHPLIMANVLLQRTGTGMSTDETGRFVFSDMDSGEYVIEVRYMGYENQYRRIRVREKQATVIEIRMTQRVLQLPSVAVSSLHYQAQIRDVPIPMTVTSSLRIENRSCVTISDVLDEEPGLHVGRDGAWGTHLVIRGLSRQKIVTLVDGYRLETATNLAAGLSLIDVYDIDRVEVIRGAASSLYGSGAMGGVVSIVTKSGGYQTQPRLHGSLISEYNSSNHGKKGGFSVHAGAPNWFFRTSGSLRSAGNTRTPEGILENSHFSDSNISALAGWMINGRHEFHVRYQYFLAEDVGIPGGDPFPEAATATYPEEKRELTGLLYRMNKPAPFLPVMSLRLFQQTIHRDVELLPNAGAVIRPGADHLTRGFQWTAEWLPGYGHRLVTGVDAWQRDLVTWRLKTVVAAGKVIAEKPVPDSDYRSIGIFMEDQCHIGPHVRMTTGGRLDHVRITNGEAWNPEYIEQAGQRITHPGENPDWEAGKAGDISWSTNAGLLYTPVADVDLSLNAARSFRSPALEERFQYIELGGAAYWGNPDLKPETGMFLDLGVRLWKPRIILTANGFYNDLNNLVVDQFVDETTYRKTNIGKALIYGFDAGVQMDLGRQTTAYGSAAYVRGRDTGMEGDLPEIPPFEGRAGLRFPAGPWLNLDVETVLAGRQDKTAAGEPETDGYALLNIFIQTKTLSLGSMRGRLSLVVENVTDQAYRMHLSTYRGLVRLEPGRHVRVMWKMER